MKKKEHRSDAIWTNSYKQPNTYVWLRGEILGLS
uniref:Uncharacterized protein n=1 Tax=Arundo donax TaxID=35708 RepID=A0A0A8ZJL6_ARUDO